MSFPRVGAAKVIYNVFRNPLTHDLGLNRKGRPKKIVLERINISAGGEQSGLREKQIEQLESGKRFTTMSGTVTKDGNKIILLVEAFYFGVRLMIERLSADKAKMSAAEAFLTKLRS